MEQPTGKSGAAFLDAGIGSNACGRNGSGAAPGTRIAGNSLGTAGARAEPPTFINASAKAGAAGPASRREAGRCASAGGGRSNTGPAGEVRLGRNRRVRGRGI